MHSRTFARLAIFFGVLALSAWPALAAPPGPPGAPPPPPPALNGTVLPDMTFDNQPLPDVLAKLQEKIPNFHTSLVADPNTGDASTLSVPKISLKDLTLGQFLDFLQTALPGLQVEVIDGPNAPLYVIHIRYVGQGQTSPVSATIVKVYSLENIVCSLANVDSKEVLTSETRKKALDEVLSLLEAALNQTSAKDETAVFKIHEPTLSLVFRGTPVMVQEVQEVLSALEPNKQSELESARHQLENIQRTLDERNVSIDELRSQLRQRTDDVEKLTTQLTETRVRLEMEQKFDRSPTSQP